MKDSITGKNIVVEIDQEYGPYVQITDYEDYDYLEDELVEKYGVESMSVKPIESNGETIGHRIYFGKSANAEIIQKYVNEIEVKNS